ncbi:leucine--tRNA ligase [Flavobacterium aurantiibacter]|uniref:Leucine--tRNA ligase n=1 Tax=Flavobacterium aurantiibacter TaxID=2023067 RepID=A0A255ZTS0_9FLAO|nr:class I tRNA ligase family protein [Flavobacterium aurantiibacter]OYQ44305.1 leucine--tRNA ligase [Flavobacterium aurantiibacter]
MKYLPNEIEAKWQKYWADEETFKASHDSEKPKYYVLDMFPYPSGAGLHVGHPLGYIASDIYARYKRHQGFNVLHPQGYDSFGLPAEQYAIQTGQHPEKTTAENIARYRQQLDRIGFSFDWSKEVRTSDPNYYKWTQFIFLQIFDSWYDKSADKARPISELVSLFETSGTTNVNAACDDNVTTFTADEWIHFSPETKEQILLQYRLTYLAETEVNWCPGLGTVLANDEIVNGVSERGGFPVIRKKMTQWSMRISAYAERLLSGLQTIDWTQSLKDAQENWIGKSTGALVQFAVRDQDGLDLDFALNADNTTGQFIEVFTTRPDTLYGVSFLTLAPEHPLVAHITTADQKAAVEAYVEAAAKKSERDRMSDVKTISGVFTGAYAIHPFTGAEIPIWIGDYVLAGYGTGAVMAVPAGDERDHAFAKFFNLPIPQIFEDQDTDTAAFTNKGGFSLMNSGFLDGLDYKAAMKKVIQALEESGAGRAKVNYRLRDAVFSRQRYWGEPFPIYYVDGLPKAIAVEHLPITLPEVEKYLPTPDGAPPLGNATHWAWDTVTNTVVSNELIDNQTIFPLELNTMPGWAGSSWYWLRYMDAKNENELFSAKAQQYWQNVDLYIGGSEHATGHLLYARFWNKFLKDRGFIQEEEPFKKLINQGMILGMSAFIHRLDFADYSDGLGATASGNTFTSEQKQRIQEFCNNKRNKVFVSKNYLENRLDLMNGEVLGIASSFPFLERSLVKRYPEIEDIISGIHITVAKLHIDISLINEVTNELDIEKLKNHSHLSDFRNAEFIASDDKIIVSREVEKMSKSKYNVVTPDDICEQYGADTLRLYEMFLGPLEQAKPWNTAGISGVFSFLKKLWRLYFDDNGFAVTAQPATPEALKVLHKTIKKVQDDIEGFSFNTSVSQFMIAVNELTALKCRERSVLEPLAVLISPYAPHIAEELWEQLGHQSSIAFAPFPKFNPEFLVESTKNYPVSFNGKHRFNVELPMDLTTEEIELRIMQDERTEKQLEGRTPKKVIIVPGKIINIVS